MKFLYSIIIMVLMSNLISAQYYGFEWAKMNGVSSTYQNWAEKVITDPNGNIYLAGSFQGSTDFDPGSGIFNINTNGTVDAYIQKLDSSGNFLWAKSFGGPQLDYVRDLSLDGAGNVYSCGSFRSTVDFDPSQTGVFNLMSAGAEDVFVQKLDVNGNFIWAISLGSTNFERALSITTDLAGNIYITGQFAGITDFDPGPGVYNISSVGSYDMFVLKLDGNGNFIWAKPLGGKDWDQGYSLTTDAHSNVYITGSFSDTADFDPDTTVSYELISNGDRDIFVQKLNSSGDFVWARTMGGIGTDYGLSIVTGLNGAVFSTGVFSNTVDFDTDSSVYNKTSNGADDIFIHKLDSNGKFVWVKTMGGTGIDRGVSITTDTYGNLFLTGDFEETVDFNPNSGIYSLTENGIGKDIFLQKLGKNGNFIWAFSMGNLYEETGYSVNVDNSGKIVTVGRFKGTIDFDPTSGWFAMSSGITSFKTYIQKLGQSPCTPNFAVDTVFACDNYTWIDGKTYYANDTIAEHTLTNATGCDSTITLNLTMSNSNTGLDVITACNFYTWIDSVTYTSSNNSASHTLINATGCDSVVSLDLTINKPNVSVTTNLSSITANAVGASYQWLDCGNNYAILLGEISATFQASQGGTYAVEVTENGCVDTSVCVTVTSIENVQNSNLSQVRCYPNPSNGMVMFDLGSVEEMTIRIADLAGQLVYFERNISGSSHTIEIDTSPGVYVVELITQNDKLQYKLIIK